MYIKYISVSESFTVCETNGYGNSDISFTTAQPIIEWDIYSNLILVSWVENGFRIPVLIVCVFVYVCMAVGIKLLKRPLCLR